MNMSVYQQFPYFQILKSIVSKNPKADSKQVADECICQLFDELISPQNKMLLNLAFKPTVTQSDLDLFLKHWDIEAAGTDRAAILAYTMKMHPELKFDSYTGPRLKGLLDYLRFQNLELIGHFSKIVKRLNKLGIEPMIIKGGAMRYLRPDLPRVMGDIDILLPSHSPWDKVKKLIYEMGYVFADNKHSIDIHPANNSEKGILDIHHFFSFMSRTDKKFTAELFSRATLKKVFMADAYLPSVEDMFFICLNNLARNLHRSTSIKGIPITLFDLVYLVGLKKDFDWNIVIKNIIQTHTEAYSYMALKFIYQVLPDIFPTDLMNNAILKRRLEDLITRDKFYVLWVHDVKYACKKLRLCKSLSNWADLKYYIRMKGQHFFTKRIIKSLFFIRLFMLIFQKKD